MPEDIKKKNLADLYSLSDFALHFRHNSQEQNMITDGGILPCIGEQSKVGDSGGEKFSKTAVSLGINGAMLTINRFLHAPFMKLRDIKGSLGHYANFEGETLENGKFDLTKKSLDYELSIQNPEDVKMVFDIMEKFFQERSYYVITNFKPIQCEKSNDISSETIEKIYENIGFKAKKDAIKELYKNGQNDTAFGLVKSLREESIQALDKERGQPVENDDGMYDKCDFNDGSLRIETYGAHNVYPKLIQDASGNYSSKKIDLKNIHKLYVDGKENSSALDIIQKMIANKDKSTYYAIYTNNPKNIEAPIVELFSAYTQIPENEPDARIAFAGTVVDYCKAFEEKASVYRDQGKTTNDPDVIDELREFTETKFTQIIHGKANLTLPQIGMATSKISSINLDKADHAFDVINENIKTLEEEKAEKTEQGDY